MKILSLDPYEFESSSSEEFLVIAIANAKQFPDWDAFFQVDGYASGQPALSEKRLCRSIDKISLIQGQRYPFAFEFYYTFIPVSELKQVEEAHRHHYGFEFMISVLSASFHQETNINLCRCLGLY